MAIISKLYGFVKQKGAYPMLPRICAFAELVDFSTDFVGQSYVHCQCIFTWIDLRRC